MKSFLRLSYALLAVLFVSCTVSTPEFKVNEGPEIKIKVGETKKLNVSGSGIYCFSVPYLKEEGFQVNTLSEMVVEVDNESLSITGLYVGKCKLVIRSENVEHEIAVIVEPNYPLWEHGLVFEKVKNLSIDSIVQELGFNYTTQRDDLYIFDNISDKIHYFGCNDYYLLFVIPISQKEYVQKSLQEYGWVDKSPRVSHEGESIYIFHNNATIKQTVRTYHVVPVFWGGYAIRAYYCDDVICLSLGTIA